MESLETLTSSGLTSGPLPSVNAAGARPPLGLRTGWAFAGNTPAAESYRGPVSTASWGSVSTASWGGCVPVSPPSTRASCGSVGGACAPVSPPPPPGLGCGSFSASSGGLTTTAAGGWEGATTASPSLGGGRGAAPLTGGSDIPFTLVPCKPPLIPTPNPILPATAGGRRPRRRGRPSRSLRSRTPAGRGPGTPPWSSTGRASWRCGRCTGCAPGRACCP